jgi:hypothetical protein
MSWIEADTPGPAALLCLADAQLRAVWPALRVQLWVRHRPFRVTFDYPGVLRVRDWDTAGLYAESLPGQPTAPAWHWRPPGGRL